MDRLFNTLTNIVEATKKGVQNFRNCIDRIQAFFIGNSFTSNARLKLAKNKGKA